jgi:hypothetical protein
MGKIWVITEVESILWEGTLTKVIECYTDEKQAVDRCNELNKMLCDNSDYVDNDYSYECEEYTLGKKEKTYVEEKLKGGK